MIFPNTNTEYGRLVVADSGRLELWLRLAGSEELILSWSRGNCGLVISVPHAGRLGEDKTEGGDLHCTDTGHVICSRQGTKDRPLVHYGRDAGTDIIAASVASGLGVTGGVVPHIITSHLHRSKVEVNVDLGRRAVQQRGQEAEFIHRLYHRWICEALQAGRESQGGGSAFLVDLHGHGHNHHYIELGYRVPATLLNQISATTSDLDWSSILSTQTVAQEFTLRKLIQRRFGVSSEAVKEGLIGPSSFAGCLTKFIRKQNVLSKVTCIPSTERPAPNNRGYYTGGYTVLKHARWKNVDCVQVELPCSVRLQPGEKRDAIIDSLTAALLEFFTKHCRDVTASVSKDVKCISLNETEMKEVCPQDKALNTNKSSVIWLWKGKKLIRK